MNQAEREQLAKRIQDAFADIPYPGDDNIGYCDAEHWVGVKRDNVPASAVRGTGMGFFTAEAYQYYFPVFACAVILEPIEADTTVEGILYPLMPTTLPSENTLAIMEKRNIPLSDYEARVH